MRARKGKKIYKVDIASDGTIIATDIRGDKITLTRSQRITLSKYRDVNYIENIKKEFSNSDIVHPEFTVIHKGVTVFTYTN